MPVPSMESVESRVTLRHQTRPLIGIIRWNRGRRTKSETIDVERIVKTSNRMFLNSGMSYWRSDKYPEPSSLEG